MNQARQFYVYAYFRPWDGSPCYIGKGIKDRIYHHEKYGTANPHLMNIIRKAKRLGLSVPKEKLYTGLTEQEAFAREISTIRAIGRTHEGGPLANLTDGGEGLSGHIPSEKTIKKIKDALHTPETQLKLSARSRGKKLSEAHKAAIRKSLCGRFVTKETRQKIREAITGKKQSAETRAKLSLLRKGRTHSIKTKQKMSASRKGVKRPTFSQEWKDRISASVKAYYKDHPMSDETREKMSKARLGKPRPNMKGRSPWNKGLRGVQVAWNKGLRLTHD